MPREIPTGTVTFLFTDIVDSTSLWHTRAGAMNEAVSAHDEFVRTTATNNNGYIFSVRGDGFGAAFSSARDAVSTATAIAAIYPAENLIGVRQGIHIGEAELRDGNYFGSEVNLASRLADAANAGQVTLSDTVATILNAGEPVKMLELGKFVLRGLTGESTIWQLGSDSFGPLRTEIIHPGNLPTQRNAFIGRQSEAVDLASSIRENVLTTVTGPGGVGKTRLATSCADALSIDFAGGAWFAALAPVTEPDQVVRAIIDAIGLPADPTSSNAEDTLERWFRSREVLLVIDNCEQVIEAVATTVDRLASVATTSRLLVTSQLPLGVSGERVFALGPLGSGIGGESTELFVERAQSVRSDFEATEEHLLAIAEICDRLDHIPLAVELAASRIRAMSPQDLAQRLDERFRLLKTRNRLAPERHQTLEAAVQWSYDLLSDDQQQTLERLAVFTAPFTIEQAEETAATESIDSWEVLNIVTDLVDRSLIVATEAEDATRYHLLESIKAFARAKLTSRGAMEETTKRYVDLFQKLALECGHELLGPGDQDAFRRIEADWLNIRVAIDAAAIDQDSTRFEELFTALGPLWNARGRALEGAVWADVLATREVLDHQVRSRALIPAAGVANIRKAGAGQPFVVEAEALWRQYGTEAPVGAMANGALQAMLNGEDESAMERCNHIIELSRDLPRDSWNREHAMTNVLAVLALVDRPLEVFLPLFNAEVAAAERHSSDWHLVTLRSTSAQAAGRMGLEDPTGYVSDLVNQLIDVGNLQTAAHTLTGVTGLELWAGNPAQAAAAQRKALDLSVDYAAGYLGLRIGLAAGVLMNAAPEVAARGIGFVRQFRVERDQPGGSRELAGEQFFEAVIRDHVGDSFDDLVEMGGATSQDEIIFTVGGALDELAATAPST